MYYKIYLHYFYYFYLEACVKALGFYVTISNETRFYINDVLY